MNYCVFDFMLLYFIARKFIWNILKRSFKKD